MILSIDKACVYHIDITTSGFYLPASCTTAAALRRKRPRRSSRRMEAVLRAFGRSHSMLEEISGYYDRRKKMDEEQYIQDLYNP